MSELRDVEQKVVTLETNAFLNNRNPWLGKSGNVGKLNIGIEQVRRARSQKFAVIVESHCRQTPWRHQLYKNEESGWSIELVATFLATPWRSLLNSPEFQRR